MTHKLIPNATLYRVALPNAVDLAKHLSGFPHIPLQPMQGKGSGFVPVPYTGDEVHTFVGGYAFSLRYDEKILPGSVIAAEVKARAAAMEDQQGYAPGRKQINELREHVTADLLRTAFIRSKVVTCLYHIDSQTLIVPAVSGKLRAEILGQLVRAVESLKTTTIHVSGAKGSLTARLRGVLRGFDEDDEAPFPGFALGSKVILAGEGGKATFDLAGELADATQGIEEAISAGGEVAEIALSANGVSFRLTQDFLLKGIKFDDSAIEYERSAETDRRYEFEQEAAIQLLLISKVVDALCEMFGYEPPAEDGNDLC